MPRYNDFRAGLHKPRLKHCRGAVRRPGDGAPAALGVPQRDEVDTVVGLFGEPVPAGFGFSDTAFRIFILMASRRLQSDRFLTVDFRPEIYSPFGMDWVAKRHDQPDPAPLPELANVIPAARRPSRRGGRLQDRCPAGPGKVAMTEHAGSRRTLARPLAEYNL